MTQDNAGTPGRLRFGLRSLLLLPLLVSPLFVSAVLVRRELQPGPEPESTPVFNLLACTVVYAAIFTARSRHCAYDNGKQGPRHVLPAARIGAWYGALFVAQFTVPWLVAMLIAWARRWEVSVFDLLSMNVVGVTEMVAAAAGMIGLFGVFLGAFGGSIVGLLFEWWHRRRDASKMA